MTIKMKKYLGSLKSNNLEIIKATKIIVNFLLKKRGLNNVLWNGGSAAQSDHFAAELVGKFKKVRKSLRSISLTGNSALITCISNDFGFENLFSRQIEGLGKKK